MRKLKFRAWDTNVNKFLYWDFLKTKIANFFDTDFLVVQEFTGMQDKNGKEIYEGDIVRIFNNNTVFLEVQFRNQYVGGWILFHNKLKGELSLGVRSSMDIEVVGNIFENPQG